MTPITIKINPRDGQRYKSISTLSWSEVPGFAILTGKNGSGKTQLLEILGYHLSGTTLPSSPPGTPLPVEILIEGGSYQPEEIAFVPSSGRFSGGTPASLANLPSVRMQNVQYAHNIHSYQSDITGMVKARRMLKRLGGQVGISPPEALLEMLGDDLHYLIDDVDVTAGLTHVFVAHRLKIVEALERRTPGLDQNGNELGPAPWEVVNAALAVAGFAYDVIPPTETKLMDTYELRMRDRISGIAIPARDLSSGEQVLLQLVLWLYTAGKEGLFPKLLLLDEPDAHLHPSMTTQFLDVVSEVLVNRHGVRVIMTTHSPSTVALAPEGSVFQLERGALQVLKVEDRAAIVSVLTAGLVTVSRATKFCFVEDEQDVSFYEAVHEILTDHGPSKDPLALRPAPSIAFVAASVGSGRAKVSGGASVVKKWVDKLDAEPLNRTFFGIIDRDAANATQGRVHVIGRYSFENYLLDPLNLYSLLLENGTAPAIQGVQVSSGDEHLLRLQPDAVLQAIADEVVARMESTEPGLVTTQRLNVTYSVGMQIVVPSWVIDFRGHDLLPIAQQAFGGPSVVTPPRLLRALRRTRLLPRELAMLLAAIQAA
jgi:energy-coupling factor transporter ATP-binding protein EcfA2